MLSLFGDSWFDVCVLYDSAFYIFFMYPCFFCFPLTTSESQSRQVLSSETSLFSGYAARRGVSALRWVGVIRQLSSSRARACLVKKVTRCARNGFHQPNSIHRTLRGVGPKGATPTEVPYVFPLHRLRPVAWYVTLAGAFPFVLGVVLSGDAHIYRPSCLSFTYVEERGPSVALSCN